MKLIDSPSTWISVAATAIVTFLCVGIVTDQWHWFQRSGSIVVVSGAVLGVRRLIRMGSARFVEDENTADYGHFQATDGEKKAVREQRYDADAALTGLILVAIGTLICGYGDLVGKIW